MEKSSDIITFCKKIIGRKIKNNIYSDLNYFTPNEYAEDTIYGGAILFGVSKYGEHDEISDWFGVYITEINDWILVDEIQEQKMNVVCECGAEKCGCGHSTWCPKYGG